MRIAALALSAFTALAHAQTGFPSRPVTLVLPSAPGDPTDLIARVLQPKMSPS
jgi:tripartite-type tricarboxylate transporter receptor subunit TctC